MFAPLGYVAFGVVSENIRLLSEAALIRMTGSHVTGRNYRQPMPKEMVLAGLIEDEGNADFARELIEEILLATLFEMAPPLICSTQGQVLSVNESLFIHADRLDWIYVRWPIDRMSEFSTYFRLSREHSFNGAAIRQRYCFLDLIRGTIAVKNNSKSLLRSFTATDTEWENALASSAEAFRGWSLCWLDTDLPSSTELLQRTFPDNDDKWDWTSFFQDEGQAKTSASERVLSELLEAFPNGKGKNTWSVVQKKVGYDRRTIERALAATGRKDWKGPGEHT